MSLGILAAFIHLVRSRADFQTQLVKLRSQADAAFGDLLLNRSIRQILHAALEIVPIQREAVLRIDRLQQIILLFLVLFDFGIKLRFIFFDLSGRTRILAARIFSVGRLDARRIFACVRLLIVGFARPVCGGSGGIRRQCTHAWAPSVFGNEYRRHSVLLNGKER
ncbi:hypothetical protein B9G55_11980 [Saccharibacillus sp. O16]|nr:hypothetical protein B9G55_11980 [Saccharibacillus sp. O16]